MSETVVLCYVVLTEKVESKVMASVLFIDFTVVRESVTLKETFKSIQHCIVQRQHDAASLRHKVRNKAPFEGEMVESMCTFDR